MKTWKIPVAWQMYGFVRVEAHTLEEAFEIAAAPETPLPDGDYVDDSFEIGGYDLETVRELWNNGQEDDDESVF